MKTIKIDPKKISQDPALATKLARYLNMPETSKIKIWHEEIPFKLADGNHYEFTCDVVKHENALVG